MSSQDAPRVTVVIPAWNLGSELVAAVDSALEQGQAVEVLIVDNATDEPLPETGGRRLVLDQRCSVAAARNAGLAAVATPYVMFLDADDRLLPGTVDYLLGRIEADPGLVMACATPVPWDMEADSPAYRPPFPPKVAYRLCAKRRTFAFANLARNLLPVTGCTLIRTDLARDAGGFSESNFGEDWALGAVLALRGRVVIDPRPGSHYAMRGGSLMARGEWSDILAVRREIRRRVAADPATPAGVRLLLPVVFGLQYVSALRRRRYRRAGAAPQPSAPGG